MKNEAEIKAKLEANLKTISSLNIELDSTHSEFQAKCIKIQELKADNYTLLDLTHHRIAEMSKLKQQLQDSVESISSSNSNKKKLEENNHIISLDVKKFNNESIVLDIETNKLLTNTNESEKFIKEMDFENNRLEKQINNLKNSNHSVYFLK